MNHPMLAVADSEPLPAPDIAAEVMKVVRRAEMMKRHIGHGNEWMVYEGARHTIAILVGPGALHSMPDWKTEEKLGWALQELERGLA